jgi:hypothetical protein
VTKEVNHTVNRGMAATTGYRRDIEVADFLNVVESRSGREERWLQSSEMGWRRDGYEDCVGPPTCLCWRCLDALATEVNP